MFVMRSDSLLSGTPSLTWQEEAGRNALAGPQVPRRDGVRRRSGGMKSGTAYVRHYPSEVIDRLLNACSTQAEEQPEAVLATGLAYVGGLNKHQIAASRWDCCADPLRVSYPEAIRPGDIRD